jgi:hypothetical protein
MFLVNRDSDSVTCFQMGFTNSAEKAQYRNHKFKIIIETYGERKQQISCY